MEGLSWQAAGVFATVMVFFAGILIGAIRLLLVQYQTQLDKRFGSLEKQLDSRMSKIDAVRDELKDYKVEASQRFVDREDWIRVEGGRDITLRKIHEQISQLAIAINARK